MQTHPPHAPARKQPFEKPPDLCERNQFANFKVLVCRVGVCWETLGTEASGHHLPAIPLPCQGQQVALFLFSFIFCFPTGTIFHAFMLWLAKAVRNHLLYLFLFFFLQQVPSVCSLSVFSVGVPEHQRRASTHIWCPSLPLRGYPLIALRSWVPQDCNNWRDSCWHATTHRTLQTEDWNSPSLSVKDA